MPELYDVRNVQSLSETDTRGNNDRSVRLYKTVSEREASDRQRYPVRTSDGRADRRRVVLINIRDDEDHKAERAYRCAAN